MNLMLSGIISLTMFPLALGGSSRFRRISISFPKRTVDPFVEERTSLIPQVDARTVSQRDQVPNLKGISITMLHYN